MGSATISRDGSLRGRPDQRQPRHGQVLAPPTRGASGPKRKSVDVALRMSDPASQLDALHRTLKGFLDQLRLPPAVEWRIKFELAVAEIAANIIEHARPPTIHFRVSALAGEVIAEFTDSGPSCRGRPGPAAMVEPLAESGRGLSLARSAVDELAYHRTGSTNRWRLTKAF